MEEILAKDLWPGDVVDHIFKGQRTIAEIHTKETEGFEGTEAGIVAVYWTDGTRSSYRRLTVLDVVSRGTKPKPISEFAELKQILLDAKSALADVDEILRQLEAEDDD